MMAILQSCCCWRSLRKGSYASAVYSAGYFSMTLMVIGNFLHSEQEYLQGNSSQPHSQSFLEETISQTTIVFNIIVLCCACLGILTSALLIYGLYSDNKFLLVPWIFTVLTTTMVDLAHSLYLFSVQTMVFDPLTAILFTFDFFLLSVNISLCSLGNCISWSKLFFVLRPLIHTVFFYEYVFYSVLCVVSQYQEYKAGRGTAEFDIMNSRIPSVKYIPQPTGTSFLSTRRAATYQETKASPPESPPKPVQGGRKRVKWEGEATQSDPAPAVIMLESPKDSLCSEANCKSGGSPSEEGGSSVEWNTNNEKSGVDTLPLINKPPPYARVISTPL